MTSLHYYALMAAFVAAALVFGFAGLATAMPLTTLLALVPAFAGGWCAGRADWS